MKIASNVMEGSPRRSPSAKSRALDILEKQLSDRAKRTIHSPLHYTNNNKTISPSKNSGIDGNALIMTISPNNKRRKLTSPSRVIKLSSSVQNNESIMDHKVALPFISPTKSLNIEMKITNENLDNNRTKSVAFSDQLESSPIKHNENSSPKILSSASKPSKSILRNSYYNQESPVNKLQFIDTTTSEILINKVSENPNDIEFWVKGEIHSLRNINDVQEYKSIIDGGINVLERNSEESRSRRFEIYATFNNIIPIVTSNTLNDIIEYKINYLIKQLGPLLEITIVDLKLEQESLLSSGEKKNPFITRLYVQIVRFLGNIASNFRIMKWMDENQKSLELFKELYELSLKALTNENSNKLMLTAQTSFLRDEKFSTYHLNEIEITKIIDSIVHIKEIPSTNLICEKLSLIKQLIIKHPNQMILNIAKWFPQEVLVRILLEKEPCTLKVLSTTISVLLDLLKRCMDTIKGHDEVYHCVMGQSMKKTLPQKRLEQLKVIYTDINYDLTLGHMLQEYIIYLINVEGESKLSMDLWLSLVALLYNSCSKLPYLLESDSDARWLEINSNFIKNNDIGLLHAIKAWRVLSFCVLSNFRKLNETNQLQVLEMLQTPLLAILSPKMNAISKTGFLYHLTGIMFTFCGISKSLSTNDFKLIWNGLINSIYEQLSLENLDPAFTEYTIYLLGNAFDQTKREKVGYRDVHPIKVIASVGVSPLNISPFPVNHIKSSYAEMSKLLTRVTISNPFAYENTLPILINILKCEPDKLTNPISIFEEFQQVLTVILKTNNIQTESQIINQYIIQLVLSFCNLLFSNDNIILKEFFSMLSSEYPNSSDLLLNVFKAILKEKKGIISEYLIAAKILSLKDQVSKDYISNWIGSILLPSSINNNDFLLILQILDTVASKQIIANVVDLYFKVSFDIDISTHLSFDIWNDDSVEYFIRLYIAKYSSNIEDNMRIKIIHYLISHGQTFTNLVRQLYEFQQDSIIKEILSKEPSFITKIDSILNDSTLYLIPLEHSSYFIKSMDLYSSNITNSVIFHIFSSDVAEGINSELIDYILPSTQTKMLNAEKLQLIENIFNKLYRSKNWLIYSNLVLAIINKKHSTILNSNFKFQIENSLQYLEPSTLVAIASKCQSFKKLAFVTIKSCFEIKPYSYVCSLIFLLLQEFKYQLFSPIIDEFCKFLTVKQIDRSVDEQNAVITWFDKFLDLLLRQGIKKVKSVIDILISYMNNQILDHYINISKSILTNPLFMSRRLRKDNSHKELSSQLEYWFNPTNCLAIEIRSTSNPEKSTSNLKLKYNHSSIQDTPEYKIDLNNLRNIRLLKNVNINSISNTDIEVATSNLDYTSGIVQRESEEADNIKKIPDLQDSVTGFNNAIQVPATQEMKDSSNTTPILSSLSNSENLSGVENKTMDTKNVQTSTIESKYSCSDDEVDDNHEGDVSIIESIRFPIFNSKRVIQNSNKLASVSSDLLQKKKLSESNFSMSLNDKLTSLYTALANFGEDDISNMTDNDRIRLKEQFSKFDFV